MRGKMLPICLALFLFFLPFFWFKSGYMDLGGDSSRLYFYDPIGYLRNYSLYAVSPSSVGAENIGFMTIPLVLIFAFVKYIGISSTYLINTFHGLSFAAAFFFVYRSITQLLKSSTRSQKFNEIAGLVGGLLYVFSPVSIYGWDKALITHNHVFLNPVMFYLLLRYVITDRVGYLFASLLVTFIFSANFSFVSAPVFFAFYPATVIFLYIYKRRALGTQVYWKQVALAFIGFILLNAFHILPQVASMFTPGSVLYTSVFSDEGKYDRGLGYFSAIVPSIKASVNIFLLPQMSKTPARLLFMILVPLVVIIGLIRSNTAEKLHRKTLVLVSMIFLAILFFATANITDLGLAIYKKLFTLPGFSIYRNYYGQWASAFFFYYTLIFGLALSIVLPMYKKIRIALGIFIVFMFINAWPFLNGSLINPILWQSKDSRIAMNMDPVFIQSIEYLRQLPSGGKVLTLPMTDPGYQIVAGKDAGAYQGPSMISYLAGKQDFAGALELGRFKSPFLESVKKGDVDTIKKILGLLNIRYIFYDNDPRVYDAFPTFPYEDVRKYFPQDQKGYSAFVRSLSLPLVQSFGDRFFVYEMPKENITPRIYIPDHTHAIARKENASMSLLLHMMKGNMSAAIEGDAMDIADTRWYPAKLENSPDRIEKNPDPPRIMHHAFATVAPTSPLYPLVMIKEKIKLRRRGDYDTNYLFDSRLFLSAKRVLELEVWRDELPVAGTVNDLNDLQNYYQEPGLSHGFSSYGSMFSLQNVGTWESILSRYFTYFDENIRMIDAVGESPQWKIEQRTLMMEYLRQHYRRVTNVLRTSSALGEKKSYLENVIDMMFADLLSRVAVDYSDLTVRYSVKLPDKERGSYDVYLDRLLLDQNEQLAVAVGSERMQSASTNGARWEKVGSTLHLREDPKADIFLSHIDLKNLITDTSREQLETVQSNGNGAQFILESRYIKGSQGLLWRIDDLKPQSHYFLKFSYRTRREPFAVRVMEGKKVGDVISETNTVVDDMLKSSSWVEYQAVIRTNAFSNVGIVQIAPLDNNSLSSSIEVKDVLLVHVPYPYIAVVQNGKRESIVQPSISFVQRDPTLYTAHISGAVKPYFLILSEDANSRWRLAVLPKSKKADDTTWGAFWVSISDFVDRIVPIRRKIIASGQHYSANIYANAWYIKPEDVNGQSEYELELYMTTQSYFYIGAAVSVVALMGLLFYGVRKYFYDTVLK